MMSVSKAALTIKASLLSLLCWPASLSSQTWLYVENYPWVFSYSDGWMLAYSDRQEFSRFSDGETVVLGGSESTEPLQLADGMLWTLHWEMDGQPIVTTVEYSADFDEWNEPALIVQQPLFDKTPNNGILLLAHIQDFYLQDDSLLVIGATLSNFAATINFRLTGENSGDFDARDESVDIVRSGTFTVEILPPEERY